MVHGRAYDKIGGKPEAGDSVPLEAQVPPDVVATPSQVRGEGEPQWWQPSWRDAARFVGYRWIFLAPAAFVVLVGVATLFWPYLFGPLWVVQIQFTVLAVGIVVTLAGYVLRRAAQARREPFCIFCGYNLTGLPDHYRCPECGRPYTWQLIAEYRRDPAWFRERWRLHRELPPADAPFSAGPVQRRRKDGT